MMEKLSMWSRLVNITEPILVEDSTPASMALSLLAILEQLTNAGHQNDYLVALLLVLLTESGFRLSRVLDKKDNQLPKNSQSVTWFSKFLRHMQMRQADDLPTLPLVPCTSKCCQKTRLVNVSNDLMSPETKVYKIDLVLSKARDIQTRLFCIPIKHAIDYADDHADIMVLSMFPNARKNRFYSMMVHTLKYVNPSCDDPRDRYINLKELSHRFKDQLVTPSRTDVLWESRLTGPSLQSLPTELQFNIIDLLCQCDLRHLSQCSNRFYVLCKKRLPSSKKRSHCQIWRALAWLGAQIQRTMGNSFEI